MQSVYYEQTASKFFNEEDDVPSVQTSSISGSAFDGLDSERTLNTSCSISEVINCPGAEEPSPKKGGDPAESAGAVVAACSGVFAQYAKLAETRLAVIEDSRKEVAKIEADLRMYMEPGENPVTNYEGTVALAPRAEDFKEGSAGQEVALAVLADHQAWGVCTSEFRMRMTELSGIVTLLKSSCQTLRERYQSLDNTRRILAHKDF